MSDKLTDRVIGAAIEVHRKLGPGLLESVYEEALCHELTLQKTYFDRQIEIDVHYKGILIKGQRLELLVEKELILELKCVLRLPEVAGAQVLFYLKVTGLKRALLLNFAEKRLVNGIQRFSL